MAPLPILRLESNIFSVSLLYFPRADAHAALPPFLFRRRRADVAPAAMGICGLLQELPGGDIKTSTALASGNSTSSAAAWLTLTWAR